MDFFYFEPCVGGVSDPTKASVSKDLFFMSVFGHIGQLMQIVLIFLCRYGQQETKLYFIYRSVAFVLWFVSTNGAINCCPPRVVLRK